MAVTEPKDERVHLRYFQWQPIFEKVKPYELLIEVPEGYPMTNFSIAPAEDAETIHDLRSSELSSFTLDQHGFCVREQPLSITLFDKHTVEGVYLPQIESLIREVVEDVEEVFFFDWRLRSSDEDKIESSWDGGEGGYIDLADPTQLLQPAEAVHIDQSPWSARQRVLHHMKERAHECLARRFRIINIWRPIQHPVEDYPLAICDASTVRQDRLIAADHVRRDYQGESYYPLYTAGYNWHYLSHQAEHEVLLFKTYDSKPDVAAVGCPHTSFRPSHVREGALPRESIEVRVLVFSAE